MHEQDLEYHADGARRVGFLAVDRARGGQRPGVLIGPEASGISDVVRDRARRLAELGYVAFAFDFVGDGRMTADMAESMALVGRYREAPERIRAIARASLDVLRAQPEHDGRTAAIGYCFGGTAVFELARDGADVACTVGFHAILATKRPDDAAQIRGKILACIGADDPMVPPEQRLAFEQEMRKAKVDWRLYLLGGAVHGFTNPNVDRFNNPALAYHKPSHERSWRAMRELFDETFGPLG